MLFVGSLLGRIYFGMIPIAVVLFIGEEVGSFLLAGIATGAYSVGTVVGGPIRSWMSVRVGHSGALLALSLASGSALLLLVLVGRFHYAAVSIVMPVAIAGCCAPPFGALLRVGWSRELPDEWVPRAFGLDSVVEESGFVLGPLVATGVVAVAGPGLAVLTCGVTCLLGGTVMSTAARKRRIRSDAGATGGRGSMWSVARSLRWLHVVFFGVGFTVGALEVVIPAFATELGRPSLAGLLLAVLAVGSAFSAFFYGRLTWRTGAPRRLLILTLLLAIGTALSAIANDLVLAVPLFVVVGVANGPAAMTAYLLADTLVETTSAKTHGAILTSVACNSGAGAGAAIAGLIIADVDVGQAFLLSGVVTATFTILGAGLYRRDRGSAVRTDALATPKRSGT